MRKLLRFALDLIVLLFLLALSPVFGQYVTLQGILQSSNGLPAVNDTISFTPTQWFYVAGTGVSVNTTTFCGTSVDGSVVGYPNPLQSLVVTPAFTGTLPAGNYYVEYAFYTQHLLTSTTTLVSPETVVQLTSTGELVIPPPASGIPAGINGMRVYIGTTSGGETLQGQTTGPATYTQSVPLVTGATPPATNTTVCIQTANDAGWPTGTGYVVSIADPSGNTLPGYPMSWQLLGPNTTINLSSGLPYYNGVVIYPSPILASPQNHATQSISGSLNMQGYSIFNVGSIQGPQFSKNVIYASGAGCAVNSNISSGGGTDDSVCLQTQLNKLAATGGTLVEDGVSLISAANVPGTPTGQTNALQMPPNTRLECTVGGGFYLASNSNVWMIGNAISGNPNSALYQPNFEIDDCTFNENGGNQNRYELGNSNNQWVGGMWFGGFNGLFLNHVNILNARTFAFYITNGESFYAHDIAAEQTAGEGGGGNNHDGLHFDGTLNNVYVTNFLDEYGDDDALAFNTDEGVYNYNNSPLAWQFARFPQSGGVISNVTIDNVQIVGTNDALRWIGYSTPNGVAQVSNITLSNVYGSVNNFMSACCGAGVQAVGGITINNWNVSPTGGGGSTLYTPPDANPLSVSNVIWSVPVVPGGGDVQAYTPFFEIGSGGLSLYNQTYNTTPVPSLSLDNSGNMYFGFSQPQTIFRVGSTNALYLNNTSGTGFTDTFQIPGTTLLQAVGPVTFGSESSYAGYGACYSTGGAIGHCTSAVGSSGLCTCVSP